MCFFCSTRESSWLLIWWNNKSSCYAVRGAFFI